MRNKARVRYSPQQPRPARLYLGHRPRAPQSSLPQSQVQASGLLHNKHSRNHIMLGTSAWAMRAGRMPKTVKESHVGSCAELLVSTVAKMLV